MRLQGAIRSVVVAGLLGSGTMGLATAADAQATTETRTAMFRQSAELRGFSLTLVQGDMKAVAATDALPPAAARALADMKDFLPFKSYMLLDSAWMTGSGPIKTQLRQSDTQTYDVELRASVLHTFTPGSPTTIVGDTIDIASFRMQRAGVVSAPAERADLENEVKNQEQALEFLRQQRVEALKRPGENSQQAAAALQAKIDQASSTSTAVRRALERMAAKDALIDTSFRMKLGETVVVGTSRLQGDRALIVLVTAVGK